MNWLKHLLIVIISYAFSKLPDFSRFKEIYCFESKQFREICVFQQLASNDSITFLAEYHR